MTLNSFMPVKLITGAGCVRASAKELAKLGKNCLIVTGKKSAKLCGALQDVIMPEMQDIPARMKGGCLVELRDAIEMIVKGGASDETCKG